MQKDDTGSWSWKTTEVMKALDQLQDVFAGLPAVRGIDKPDVVPAEEIIEALRLQAPPARRELVERILRARDLLRATMAETAGLYCELNGALELRDRLKAKAEELAEKVVPIADQAPIVALPGLDAAEALPDLELERPGMLDRIRARLYRLVVRKGGQS